MNAAKSPMNASDQPEGNAQTATPSVSVVISTLNRADMLEKALRALEQQNYPRFEVVVVNGPSTDHTDDVLAAYDGRIIIGHTDEANLSRSRNVGINLSSGELVLFLDDDAFAEPNWIADIVGGYDDPSVGGVGTRVYDHTGFNLQMNPFLIDKYYRPDFKRQPPLWGFEFSDSTTIPHILGASSSFRRDVLQKVGGFDEEIEYFLDESELCRRVTEAGYKIRFLDVGASVHHQFASGVTRDERRLLTHPYPVVKNKYYVCLSDWRRNGGSLSDYLQACNEWLQELTDGARWQVENRGISQDEYRSFMSDVERGVIDGRLRALAQERKSIAVTPARPAKIKPFGTVTPPGGRRTICFISRWTPQRSPGGIARYMWDLSIGFARKGYETHLITLTDGPSQVEFHDGLWIRHLSQSGLPAAGISAGMAATLPELKSGAARSNVGWAKLAHQEVMRLRNDRFIDLVVAPVWDQEGLYCALDNSLRTVISMNTTFRRFAGIEWRSIDRDTLDELSALESLYISSTNLFHANSTSSMRHLLDDFAVSPEKTTIVTVPHGVSDLPERILAGLAERRGQSKTSSKSGRQNVTKILYVSRLERRKGTDLFLSACANILRARQDVEIHVVGRDPYAGDPEKSLKMQFERSQPAAAEQVHFHGQLSDADLIQYYEEADIFCVPSRYESFGIIFVEAMRYHLPVVALAIGGAEDIVIDGETGVLCKGQSASEVANALLRLIDDPTLRKKMGAAARKRYAELFEDGVVVGRTIEAYEHLLDVAGVAKPNEQV